MKATIPAEHIEPVIYAYTEGRGISVEELSIQIGLHEDVLRKALDRGKLTWDLADRVLAKTGMFLLWYEEPLLSYYYEGKEIPPDRAKPIKCARETCNNWFEIDTEAGESRRMSIRRFCSSSCQNTDASWRRGEAQPRHRRCRNGHKREVGVYMTKKGNKVYQRCAKCHREARRRSYLKNEVPRRMAA